MNSAVLSKPNKRSVCLINNIPSPYRRVLFDEIALKSEQEGLMFSVLYLSDRESVRDWTVEFGDFESVLPVRHQSRNPATTTSDHIVNVKYCMRVARPSIVVLFGYNYRTYIVTALVRWILRRDTHLFCETTLSDTGTSIPKKAVKSLMFRTLFQRFLVPGQRSAEYLIAHGVRRDRIFLARNASPLRPAQTPVPNRFDRLRLLFVGRLAPEKRILEFARAFLKVDEPATLTVVGDGPLMVELAGIAARDKRIEILGSLPSEQLSDVYARHDVLVLVSASEPWGFVVNEAINHRLALLLSPQIGCAPDLLDGNGVQLEKITPPDIAAALHTLRESLSSYQARSHEIATETTVANQAAAFIAIISGKSDATF